MKSLVEAFSADLSVLRSASDVVTREIFRLSYPKSWLQFKHRKPKRTSVENNKNPIYSIFNLSLLNVMSIAFKHSNSWIR